MPKRKVASPLTPPQSAPASITSSSRRSSRAVPRKSYAHADLIDDPDVYEDPLDREASPDQTSELSAPPSDFEMSEAPSENDADPMSDDSLIHEKPTPAKKAKTTKAKTAAGTKTTPGKSKSPPKAEVAGASPAKSSTNGSPVKKKGVKVEAEEEEVQYDSDGEVIEKKGPTKADKHRERDARAAERYADFEARPPTVDSDYVPVPFKGRLGYACLNTILRSRKEPVFCSRTTRIATIAKEDKGMPFVLELGRQNAADLSKMLEWNEKYGIRFFRLSSEMFPFASHPDYLYNLEHADAELKAAGAIANRYDHRVTCHPGQFTQIASPIAKVFENAVRDLEFHNELLTRMQLQPEQRDRDAVLILHLGGAYGDKPATLDRFRTNYAKLSEPVKRRLVLENDDMSWSVTDLLPLCQELNIPLVLDWHHHNVVHDEEKFREGSLDILPLLPAIAETWIRKGIKQKMHISEPRLPNHPLASQRRSHSARVYHLPPCADDMDIMIEAKDKEQAVFELSKQYNLQNPPLPPEVVGDGPGAKGDEAYWPEGQELRLKVTKTRVKKEPEYDSDGNEIKKKSPKKRATKVKAEVKEEEELDESSELQEERSASPSKGDTAVKLEDSGEGSLEPTPKPRRRAQKPKDKVEAKEFKEEDAEKTIDTSKSRSSRSRKVKLEDGDGNKENATKETPKKSTRKGRSSASSVPKQEKHAVAATETELQTGVTAEQIVDDAFEKLQAEQQLRAADPASQVSQMSPN